MESVASSGVASRSRPGSRPRLRPEVRWGIGVAVVVALLWEMGGRYLEDLRFLVPPLSRVLAVGWEMIVTGALWAEIRPTLVRVVLGLSWGFTAGVGIGVAMALVPVLRWTFEPLIAAVYPMPKIALLPLFLIAFGLGDTSRVVLIGLSTFFIVVITTAGGLRSLDPMYGEAMRNLGAGTRLMIRRLLLPGALPGILTGLRLASATALLITLAVEFTAARDGIGWMMWMAWQTFALERLYIGLIVCAALGLGLASGVRALERRLAPWLPREG